MDYAQYVKPFVGRLLSKIKIDKNYHRSFKNKMYYKEGGQEIEVIDFISGYGSLLLGHNNENIAQRAIDLLQEQVPIHAQLSEKNYPAQLAKILSSELESKTGSRYISTFANTGTEATEAALKHLKLSYYRRVDNLRKKLIQQFHAIDNFFVKKGYQGSIEVDDQIYANIETFKWSLINKFDRTIEELIPFTIAIKKAFHGKTSGSLDITFNENFRKFYQLNKYDKQKTKFIDCTEEALDQALENATIYIDIPKIALDFKIEIQKSPLCLCLGLIVEPIQGEGGVIPVSKSFLNYSRKITSDKHIPLVFDEIQCGFFRTGELFHSFHHKVYADYYLLAKSLGGGIVKNAVLLVSSDHYDEDFGYNHTSTFAEDEFSCAVSIAAYHEAKKLLPNNDFISRYLFSELEKLKLQYPGVVEEIRGCHLMVGVKFYDFDYSNGYSFQMISRTGFLNYFLASYLLNNYKVRIAPTLSDKSTIRIQPSLVTTKEEIDQLIAGLRAVCQIMDYRDFYKFIEHLLPEEEKGKRDLKDFGRKAVPLSTNSPYPKIAFITHYINENGARAGDESTEILSDNSINQMLGDVMEIATPIILGNTDIESPDGSKINMHFIGVLFTANMARKMLLENNAEHYEFICDEAINMAQEEFGCKLIGLGQYSSVITKNGKTISNPHVKLTTGNSFTVSIGIDAVKTEIESKINAGQKITLGLLGAGGNIISVYTKCMLAFCSEVLLKGSDSKSGLFKTTRFAKELLAFIFKSLQDAPDKISNHLRAIVSSTDVFQAYLNNEISLNEGKLWENFCKELGDKNPIKLIEDLTELRKCDVTAVATNSANAFLTTDYFSPGSVVYDISVPVNCTKELINNNLNIKVILGGIVQLPNKELFPMKGYPLGKGESFACISETILLGMENFNGNFSFGNLIPEQIEAIKRIGKRHNFKFLKPKLEEIF